MEYLIHNKSELSQKLYLAIVADFLR